VRTARHDAAARAAWAATDRPMWELRPTPRSPLGDVAVLGGLGAGLAALCWALARSRRERRPSDVTIGEAADVDFPSTAAGVVARFALVAPRGDGFVLRVPAGAAIEPASIGRQADGSIETELAADARFRIAAGAQAWLVRAVAPPRAELAVAARFDRRVAAFAAGSTLAHLALLAIIAAIPPDARALNDDQLGLDGREIYVTLKPAEPPKAEPAEDGQGTAAGLDGKKTAGTEGQMGSKTSTATEGRFAHEKRDDRPRLAAPTTSAEARARARKAGILGLWASRPQNFVAMTGTEAFSSGLDDRTVYGGHIGRDVGEMAGGWGYGIYGFGPGAGGVDGSTIAVGEYDLGGPGGPGRDPSRSGNCGLDGTARCRDGHDLSVKQRTSRVPDPTIGPSESDGGLDPQIIRRKIREKLSQIRFCYERALVADHDLAGTSTVAFTISPQGVVQGAGARGLGGAVDGCITDVIESIQFPAPKGGGYVKVTSYPFTFQPAGS
jgi:hypothetical protein